MEPIRINHTPSMQKDGNIKTANYINFGASLEADTFVSSSNKPKKSFFASILNTLNNFFRPQVTIEEPEQPQPAPTPSYDLLPYEEPEEELPVTEMSKFLESPDYEAKIKKAAQGKYQAEFTKMLSLENLDKDVKRELITSGLTEEEFLDAIKKLSKSTFKVALNQPTQYINYTQDALFQRFTIDSMMEGKSFKDMEESSSAYMAHFFGQNIVKMARALQYIDTDALNQMMDKRSTSFSLMLRSLNRITPENGKLLKELLSRTTEGDANQKIKLCQLVEIFQSNGFDTNLLKGLLETDPIDTSSLNDMFKEAFIKKAGLNEADEKTNTNFNPEYMHLLFSEFPVLNNGIRAWGDDFQNLLKAAVKGDFDNYIQDETNEYGRANKNTKEAFEKFGLNYENWLHPDMAQSEFNYRGKNMSLELWDRNPQEDIFLGNKTRCCTAIATGSNGAAMSLFLLNTSFNVIELKDNKNDVKGMARIFMSDVEGEPSLIIDSIELTDIKQMEADDKLKIADEIFKYASDYAETITGRPTKVYYIEQDSKLELFGKKNQVSKRNAFIGDVSSDRVYSNRDAGSKWDDIRESVYTYFIEAN